SVVDAILNAGLGDYLMLMATRPHAEAVQLMESAQVLLLCIFEPTRFVLTGKLFEYLASKRPILCIGPTDGDAAAVLTVTGAGVTFSAENKIAIRQHLIDLYQKFKGGQLKHFENNARHYSHRELVKQIAAELNQITRHNS